MSKILTNHLTPYVYISRHCRGFSPEWLIPAVLVCCTSTHLSAIPEPQCEGARFLDLQLDRKTFLGVLDNVAEVGG